MTDTMKALADRLEAHTEQMANTSWGLTMQEWNVISNDILLAARTLRAALAPAADDEVEAIRARHEAARDEPETWITSHAWAHNDRATLLRHVDRLTAELEAERERRVEVEKAARNIVEGMQLSEYESLPDDRGFSTRLTNWNHEDDFTLGDLRRLAASPYAKDTP